MIGRHAADWPSPVALATVLAVSAFGPYLVGGLRLEQFVVYGLAAWLLPRNLRRLKDMSAPARGFVACWLAILVLSMVRLVFPDASDVPRGSLLAGADNLLLPLVAFGLGVTLARPGVLRRVAAVVAVGMSVNTVIALGQVLEPIAAASQWWWSAGGAGESVGERALTMGRLPGLMNQPALAGVAYGVALLCAVYAFRRRPWWLWPVVGACMIGGMLVVSKAFLLIGLPIAAWQIVASAATRRERLVIVGAGVGGTVLVVAGAWLSGWAGFKRLTQSVPFLDGGGLRDLTGGRYGSGNDEVAATVGPVVSEHLWFGLGLRGHGLSTDSAWFQMLAYGGVFAVVAFVAALGFLAWGWWRARGTVEARLLAGLLLLVAGASLGFPALTANRLSVWLGLLFGLLIAQPMRVSLIHDPARMIVSDTSAVP